jgi:hypothetical protein
MKLLLLVVLISLPAFSYADQFYKDYVYKCVKDGKTTYQEMPCGWSAKGKHPAESDKTAQQDAMQSVVPMSDFCNDKTISDQNTLKKGCTHFYLPKESR